MSVFDRLRRHQRAIVRSIFVGVAALVTAFHVAPWAAPMVARPRLPSVVLSAASEAVNKSGYAVSPAMKRNILQAAQHDLLNASPYYFFALTLSDSENADRVLALLDEAVKRNPRHYFARRWRARLYNQRGDAPKAVREISRLFSLDPGHGAAYVDALVDLAQFEQSHETLLRLIAERPPWSDAFVRRANQILTDGEFLVALASTREDANNEYVRTLANQGEFERAFLVWQTSKTKDELLQFSWPADPQFRDKDMGGGIGWRTNSALATREADGLYVYFDGKGESVAAEQTMLLGAGYSYALSATMSGSIQPQSGVFRWRLACTQDQQIIAELTVSSGTEAPKAYVTSFFVPNQGCAVQTLSLKVSSGQYMLPAHLKISEVKIAESPDMQSTSPPVSSDARERPR